MNSRARHSCVHRRSPHREAHSPRAFGRGGGDCGDREASGPGQRVGGDAPRPFHPQSGSPASGDWSPHEERRTVPVEAAPSPAAGSGLDQGRLRPGEPRVATRQPVATAAARPRLLRLPRLPGGGCAVPAPSSPSPPLTPPAPPPPGARAALTRRPVPPSAPRRLLLGGSGASLARCPRCRRRSRPASAIFPPPCSLPNLSPSPSPARGLFRKVFIFRLRSRRKELRLRHSKTFRQPRPSARPAER